ncbi:hypothetical protein RN01_24925 [Cupriavidus sp. SHE]|uniref:hypothetical protein n=1 Tax=Cupriavidus TaxID=106589 RepID=UPI000569D36B|nr:MULTISPECIES: hypothetical protein [Cupriavidus]KWR78025.1 hypothetical protein RN01_24925 [Cupriavidus sp. SHE]GMG94669.1 hypothetical protein Cmtc_58890 [Cupriavidus sp. TKC]
MSNQPTSIANPTVIVHLSGGLVREVESDGYPTVIIVDHDIEGADVDELKAVPGGQEALVRSEPVADVSRQAARHWVSLAE